MTKITTKAVTRAVGYAYPTSSLATQLGWGREGTWYFVGVDADGEAIDSTYRAVIGHQRATEQAVDAFEHLPWDAFSMHLGSRYSPSR